VARVGSGQFFVARVGSGRVSNLWFEFKMENFPLKCQIFSLRIKKNLFGSGQKVPRSKAGRPLIYCGSKVSSGRVRSGPITTVNLNLSSRITLSHLLCMSRHYYNTTITTYKSWLYHINIALPIFLLLMLYWDSDKFISQLTHTFYKSQMLNNNHLEWGSTLIILQPEDFPVQLAQMVEKLGFLFSTMCTHIPLQLIALASGWELDGLGCYPLSHLIMSTSVREVYRFDLYYVRIIKK